MDNDKLKLEHFRLTAIKSRSRVSALRDQIKTVETIGGTSQAYVAQYKDVLPAGMALESFDKHVSKKNHSVYLESLNTALLIAAGVAIAAGVGYLAYRLIVSSKAGAELKKMDASKVFSQFEELKKSAVTLAEFPNKYSDPEFVAAFMDDFGANIATEYAHGKSSELLYADLLNNAVLSYFKAVEPTRISVMMLCGRYSLAEDITLDVARAIGSVAHELASKVLPRMLSALKGAKDDPAKMDEAEEILYGHVEKLDMGNVQTAVQKFGAWLDLNAPGLNSGRESAETIANKATAHFSEKISAAAYVEQFNWNAVGSMAAPKVGAFNKLVDEVTSYKRDGDEINRVQASLKTLGLDKSERLDSLDHVLEQLKGGLAALDAMVAVAKSEVTAIRGISMAIADVGREIYKSAGKAARGHSNPEVGKLIEKQLLEDIKKIK